MTTEDTLTMTLRSLPEASYLDLQGDVTIDSYGRMRPEFFRLAETTHVPVIVSIDRLVCLDSSGLALLMALYRILKSREKRMLLVSQIPVHRRILVLSGLTKIIEAVQSEEEAQTVLRLALSPSEK